MFGHFPPLNVDQIKCSFCTCWSGITNENVEVPTSHVTTFRSFISPLFFQSIRPSSCSPLCIHTQSWVPFLYLTFLQANRAKCFKKNMARPGFLFYDGKLLHSHQTRSSLTEHSAIWEPLDESYVVQISLSAKFEGLLLSNARTVVMGRKASLKKKKRRRRRKSGDGFRDRVGSLLPKLHSRFYGNYIKNRWRWRWRNLKAISLTLSFISSSELDLVEMHDWKLFHSQQLTGSHPTKY